MYTPLYKFLDTHKILYPLQFDFRENHSTMQALMSLTEIIKHSIDSGKFGCGIFLDLQKAFDTVSHDILLKKLEHYGIRGNVLNWCACYIKGRSQYVTVNEHPSEILPITLFYQKSFRICKNKTWLKDYQSGGLCEIFRHSY